MTAFTSNWFVFFPLAFSLFVAIRLAEGSVDRGQSQFGLLVIRSLIGLLFLFSIFAVGLRTSLLGLCWILLLVVFTAVIVWKKWIYEKLISILFGGRITCLIKN